MTCRTLLFAFMLISLGAGCANLQIGAPIPVNAVQRIRPGYTTKTEILSLFGQPLRNVPGPEGEIWVYRYLDGKNTAQELVVSFNGSHVSTSKLY
jgi:hypothetical protein